MAAGCGRSEESAAAPPAEAPESSLQAPVPVHPDFTLALDDLSEMTGGLPSDIRENILKRPEYFLELTGRLLDLPQDLLVLVNKEKGLSAGDNPEDLAQLDDYPSLVLSRPGHRLRNITLPPLLAMTEAARQEGIALMVSSAYRPYEYQEMLYNRYVEKDGQEAADRYSAKPGKSQHQLGTVIDFGSIDDSFADTDAGQWMTRRAGEFGFSLSYPRGMEEITGYQWESWHFRYITPAGTEMQKEFFGDYQEYLLRFLDSHREALSRSRIVQE